MHDDVRIVACLVNQYSDTHLAYSSYTMPLSLAFHRMVWGWDSDVIFFKFFFAAVRDSLDVAAPGDCSSAIKPKIEHRPIFLPATPVSGRADRMLGIDGGQASGGTAPFTGSRGTWVLFCFSMFALCPQVSAVCPSAITWVSGATPYAEDKAERLMATSGHFLEDMIALFRQRNK